MYMQFEQKPKKPVATHGQSTSIFKRTIFVFLVNCLLIQPSSGIMSRLCSVTRLIPHRRAAPATRHGDDVRRLVDLPEHIPRPPARAHLGIGRVVAGACTPPCPMTRTCPTPAPWPSPCTLPPCATAPRALPPTPDTRGAHSCHAGGGVEVDAHDAGDVGSVEQLAADVNLANFGQAKSTS